jgi:nucleotide-binding universal stress UspA family protein
VPLGRAGGVLMAAAEARQASLVVIGTAGWHSPFGTTARYVIQHAPCPVLAVPRGPGRAHGRPRPPHSATVAHP